MTTAHAARVRRALTIQHIAALQLIAAQRRRGIAPNPNAPLPMVPAFDL